MKIQTLIKKLQEVEKVNPKATVYLTDTEVAWDFTGFSVDDVCDVDLYVSGGDEVA